MSNNLDCKFTGAELLLKSLEKEGIDTFFANPGTSEMHLVTAIGRSSKTRPILCLFEGVVTAAADGFWRMRANPAATLLHLGPGYANGMANLHNAKKAFSAMVNIIGDHAEWHLQFDAPLTSDLEGHVKLHSDWFNKSVSATNLGELGTLSCSEAKRGWGKIASIIVPANHSWETGQERERKVIPNTDQNLVSSSSIKSIAETLSVRKKRAFLLGNRGLTRDSVKYANSIAKKCEADLLCETFFPRVYRGAGQIEIARIPYFAELAVKFLADYEEIFLVGAKEPVGFFAYPDIPSKLSPSGCSVVKIAVKDENVEQSLIDLCDELDISNFSSVIKAEKVVQTTSLTLDEISVSNVISRLLPENSIISDEGITCSAELYKQTNNAAPHDWLCLTGGSIGQGLPLGFGASIACPDRKVVTFQADGSAMYTVQTLWSMARENTDVTVILLNNSSYAILNIELDRLKTGERNDKILSMLNIGNPTINWVEISKGLGVEASRASSVKQFSEQFYSAMNQSGPRLIEVIMESRPSIR
ncbi:MAG: acetolactate synthase large subunit [Pseudomonadota bacterium]|nr:acetolactate synthase large subunit [Pseudomonadota bacterium]